MSITLQSDAQDFAFLTDAMLNLATLACELPSFRLQQKANFAQNTVLAAESSLRSAIAPVKHSVQFRWWGSVQAAEGGSSPFQGASCDGASGILEEKRLGAKAVLEFKPIEGGEAHLALTSLNSSDALDTCESVCPGFTQLLYSTLENVNAHIWPIITPRTLWNDMSHRDDWWGLDKPCDSEVARNALMEYCDDAELAKKYGVGDLTKAAAQDALSIFEEEIGGVLPSTFIRGFGHAAVGTWNLNADSPCGRQRDPEREVAEDICVAMQNMEVRMSWCSQAPLVNRHLKRMHQIVREIRAGARFADGANHLGLPSHSAIQVCGFRHERQSQLFFRLLDDAADAAQQCGDTVDTPGWFCRDMSTLDTARRAISSLQRGAEVLQQSMELLLDLYFKKEDDE